MTSPEPSVRPSTPRSANSLPTSSPQTMPTSSVTTNSHPRPRHRIAAKAIEQRLGKNGYQGASVTCSHCGQAAEFHSHRTHTPLSLVGPICYPRAYYLCRRCGLGLFPFDEAAGLTARRLTPALERVATLAGTVADSFEKGAELLEEMAGFRLESRPSNGPPKTPVSAWRRPSGRRGPRPQGGLALAQGLRRPTVRLRRARRHRRAAAR